MAQGRVQLILTSSWLIKNGGLCLWAASLKKSSFKSFALKRLEKQTLHKNWPNVIDTKTNPFNADTTTGKLLRVV